VVSVVVDTSALFALLDRLDAHHTSAVAFWTDADDEGLVTRAYVVVETIALVRSRLRVAAPFAGSTKSAAGPGSQQPIRWRHEARRPAPGQAADPGNPARETAPLPRPYHRATGRRAAVSPSDGSSGGRITAPRAVVRRVARPDSRRPQEASMRVSRVIVAAVLFAVGLVWIGQGTGKIAGSAMSGTSFWAAAGLILVVLAIVILVRERRLSAKGSRSRLG
jgi:hypothetical protein